jgi:putative oxidoreductase
MSSTTSRAGGVSLDLYLLVARILLVVIFPISGYAKLTNVAGTVTFLTSLGTPIPGIAVWFAIGFELVLPALIVIGLFTRWAALGLIIYTACTIILAHRFWEFTGPAQFNQTMSFFKNVSVMLGLGFIMQFGPGKYALKP